MTIKGKIVSIVTLTVLLASVIFSNYSVLEVEAAGNQVTLSSKDVKYYGIFVAGEGNAGPDQAEERKAFDNSAKWWEGALLDTGKGWDKDRMSFLQQPTPKQLNDSFNDAKANARAGDEFHFYYGGHGAKNTGTMYLKDGVYLSEADLKGNLSGFVKGVTISVTLDSCGSYLIQDSIQDIVDSEGKRVDPTCLATIASTSVDHKQGYLKKGVWLYFSVYLLTTFHGADKRDPVYAKDLFKDAADRTEKNTKGESYEMRPSYAALPEHAPEKISFGGGDVNHDGATNMLDLAIMARSLGTDVNMSHGTGWGEFNPDCDLNGDGRVDAFDFAIVTADYGWGDC